MIDWKTFLSNAHILASLQAKYKQLKYIHTFTYIVQLRNLLGGKADLSKI